MPFGFLLLVYLFCALIVSGASSGENESSTTTVHLKYTYRRDTSHLMTNLPKIMANRLEHDLHLSSEFRKDIYVCELLHSEPLHATVYTLCADIANYDHLSFRIIPRNMIKTETPLISKMMEDNWQSVFSRYSVPEQEAVQAIPGIDTTAVLPRHLLIVREDLLNDIGFSIDGSERIPLDNRGIVSFVDHDYTLKEFLTILDRLQSQLQVTPLVGNLDRHFATIFGMFGLPVVEAYDGVRVTPNGIPNTSDVDTKKSRPNVQTSQFCDLVDLLSDLYNLGLINTDYFLSQNSTREIVDQIISGDAVIIPTLNSSEHWVRYIIDSQLRPDKARFAFLPPPVGPHGQGTVRIRSTVDNRTSMAMSAGADDAQVRAALRVLEYMKLTAEGYSLGRLGTDHAIELNLAEGLEPTPGDETPPHFPFFPYYRLYFMYAVTDGKYGAQLLDYLSQKEMMQWARMPDFWWVTEDREMRDIFLTTGEPLNTHLWNGFIDLIASNSYNACSSFQSALEENEN